MWGEIMGNITLAIPEDMHKEMKHFSEVKWSEVARKAILSKIETLRLAEKLVAKSKLTEKDIVEFDKRIKATATKRFMS